MNEITTRVFCQGEDVHLTTISSGINDHQKETKISSDHYGSPRQNANGNLSRSQMGIITNRLLEKTICMNNIINQKWKNQMQSK